MNAHINDCRAFFDILFCNKFGFSNRNNQDICLSAQFLQIFCSGMSHCHRCIFPQHQHSHRFSNDIASSENHAVFSFYLNIGSFQQLNYACRCTRQKSFASDHQCPCTLRMKTIDILGRINSQNYFLLIDMCRQWKLHENSTYFLFVVQLCDQCQQFFF